MKKALHSAIHQEIVEKKKKEKKLLSCCSMPGIYVGTEWRFIGEQDWCDSIPQGKTNDFYKEWGVFG